MRSAQRERQLTADRQVAELRRLKATPDQILMVLNRSASDPAQLHHTPHLVTAIGNARLWDSLTRAELRER